jgi:hypothetical protein
MINSKERKKHTCTVKYLALRARGRQALGRNQSLYIHSLLVFLCNGSNLARLWPPPLFYPKIVRVSIVTFRVEDEAEEEGEGG